MTEYDYALVENTRAAKGNNPIVAYACLHAVSPHSVWKA